MQFLLLVVMLLGVMVPLVIRWGKPLIPQTPEQLKDAYTAMGPHNEGPSQRPAAKKPGRGLPGEYDFGGLPASVTVESYKIDTGADRGP